MDCDCCFGSFFWGRFRFRDMLDGVEFWKVVDDADDDGTVPTSARARLESRSWTSLTDKALAEVFLACKDDLDK